MTNAMGAVPDLSRPYICAILGWLRLGARTSASRWNRASRSGSGQEGVGQDLQCIVAFEREMVSPPDLAHPAFANEG